MMISCKQTAFLKLAIVGYLFSFVSADTTFSIDEESVQCDEDGPITVNSFVATCGSSGCTWGSAVTLTGNSKFCNRKGRKERKRKRKKSHCIYEKEVIADTPFDFSSHYLLSMYLMILFLLLFSSPPPPFLLCSLY